MWARSVECIASMGPPEANTARCYARPHDARPAGTRVMDAGAARRRGFHSACWRCVYLVLRLPSVALYAANAIISVKNARSGISASDSVAVRYRPRSYRHALRQRRADPTRAHSGDKADRKADRNQVTRKIREVSPREIVNQCVGEAEISRI